MKVDNEMHVFSKIITTNMLNAFNFKQSCLNMGHLKKTELLIIAKDSLSAIMLFSTELTLNFSLKAA